mgnify:CR=1 FL=1
MAIKDTTKKPYLVDGDTNIFIGLDLPIRKSDGKEGYFASTTTTIEAIKNNIRNLLLTQQGERLMQPSFGMNLRKFLFEQLNDNNLLQMREEIIDTFSFWLPFVIIRDLKIQSLNSVQVSLTGTSGEISPITDGGY